MAVAEIMKNAGEVTLSELDARDRIETLLCFLGALLEHAEDDLASATGREVKGETERRATSHAYCSIAMAKEYLEEINRLEQRPLPQHSRTVSN